MEITPEATAGLIRLIDSLEEGRDGYLFLDAVHEAGGEPDLTTDAIARDLLLVDHRRRFDRTSHDFHDVLVCRLNRHHPTVLAALSSD